MKSIKYAFLILPLFLLVANVGYAGRYYDCRVARWTTPDPLMQCFPEWSPYNYTFNNPLRFVDPNGLAPGDSSHPLPMPEVVVYGQRNPNYISGQMTTMGWIRYYMDYPLFLGMDNPNLVRSDNGTRWYAPKPTMVLGIVNLPAMASSSSLGESIKITQTALEHILSRHMAAGISIAGKSIFSAGEDITQLVKAAENVSATAQAGGNYERIVDAGRIIGTDRATGATTSVYTVITNAANELITAFPGKP